MKGIGAGTGVAVGVGVPSSMGYAPVGRSQAIAPVVAAGLIAAGGAAAGYLLRDAVDKYTGNDVNADKYDGLNADETHADIREDAVSMSAADDAVFTNISNLLNLAPNGAYNEGKYAAIEAMNLGDDLATTKNKAGDAIDAFYDKQVKNLLDHMSIQVQKVWNMVQDVNDTSSLNNSDVFAWYDSSDSKVANWSDGTGSTSNDLITGSVSLPSGTNYSYKFLQAYNGSGIDDLPVTTASQAHNYQSLRVQPISTGEDVMCYDHYLYYNAYDKMTTQHSNVVSEVNTWIDNVHPNYTEGDVALTDLLSASQLADMAPDQDGFSWAAAELALLNVPGAKGGYTIHLEEDDVVVEGTIYAQGQQNDLELGITYRPSQLAGTVWLAYDYETCVKPSGVTDPDAEDCEKTEVRSELAELDQPFTITDGTVDGEAVESVSFTGNNQQTLSTDPAEYTEQMKRINELRDKLKEQRNETALGSGGGGGIFGGKGVSQWAADNPAAAGAGGIGVVALLKYLFAA